MKPSRRAVWRRPLPPLPAEDGARRRAMLRLRSGAIAGLAQLQLVVLAAAGAVWVVARPAGNTASPAAGWAAAFKRLYLDETALVLLLGVLCALFLYRAVWDLLRTAAVYRAWSRGASPEAEDACWGASRHLAVQCVLAAAALLLAGAMAVQHLAVQTLPPAEQTDGPCLRLEDLGVEGVHGTGGQINNAVTHVQSLAAERWSLNEQIGGCWMFEQVYRLRTPEQARESVAVLMRTAQFEKDPENYLAVAIDGLDGAWLAGGSIQLEAAAVDGCDVYFFTCAGGDAAGTAADPERVLEVLGQLRGSGLIE